MDDDVHARTCPIRHRSVFNRPSSDRKSGHWQYIFLFLIGPDVCECIHRKTISFLVFPGITTKYNNKTPVYVLMENDTAFIYKYYTTFWTLRVPQSNPNTAWLRCSLSTVEVSSVAYISFPFATFLGCSIETSCMCALFALASGEGSRIFRGRCKFIVVQSTRMPWRIGCAW